MTTPKEILDSLVESANKDVNEIKLGTIVKAGLGVAAIKALTTKKLPPPSKHNRPINAIEYAKALNKAKNQKEALMALIGLLNISARVLLQIPSLRDLGFRLQKIVNSERLEDFFSE